MVTLCLGSQDLRGRRKSLFHDSVCALPDVGLVSQFGVKSQGPERLMKAQDSTEESTSEETEVKEDPAHFS